MLYYYVMDEFKHIKQERTEEDSEVQLTDLPLLSNAGGKRSVWLARLLLGWQGSLRQRHWRQIGAVATLLLMVLATLVVLSPLHRNSAPSLVQPSPSRNPFLATYRSHPLLIYRGHSGAVRGVSWSPDGTRIASGGEDGTVQVWNATTGERVLTYQQYADALHSVSWSPDGTRISSTGQDNSVQVWDTSTGKRLVTYQGHAGSVGPAAWSPDGKRIASGSNDGRV
jgi:WD40 repeat protein